MEEIAVRLQDLKERLSLELQKTESDANVILRLSTEIAELDQSTVRFTVDAALINRLGKELVGRQETAVSELVKNSYDADAISVELKFENCNNPGGRLTIDDNGLGMTREQLIKGFMTLSSSDKSHFPKSERYQRQRAGQKGIGRFATQRIGRLLTIITQTLQSEKALKVEIDWDKYMMDSNLLLITNSIQEINKQKNEGTTLIIDGVRDKWLLTSIEKTYKYISELLQPFPLSERFEQSVNDPGFKASFFRDGELIADESISFFQHALAEIEGYVDNDGQGFYSFKSEKLSIPEEVYLIGKKERDDKFTFLKNVHLKAFYFIYNVGLIPKKI